MPAITVDRLVPADHPAFAGHFPGRPLLPGVLLLSEVLEAALAQPALRARLHDGGRLSAAKFLSPVGPGATLRIALDWNDAGLRFEVRHDGGVAARGQWAWSEVVP